MVIIRSPISKECQWLQWQVWKKANPNDMQGFQVINHAIAYEAWKQDGGRENNNPCLLNGVKRKNVHFYLPYWKVWIKNHFLNIIKCCFPLLPLLNLFIMGTLIGHGCHCWKVAFFVYYCWIWTPSIYHCVHTSIGYFNIVTITKRLPS